MKIIDTFTMVKGSPYKTMERLAPILNKRYGIPLDDGLNMVSAALYSVTSEVVKDSKNRSLQMFCRANQPTIRLMVINDRKENA